MLTRKRVVKLLALLVAVSLLLAACDRPFPSNDNDNEGPTSTEVGYPPAQVDNTAVEPEPTQEVMEEVEEEMGEEETSEETGATPEVEAEEETGEQPEAAETPVPEGEAEVSEGEAEVSEGEPEATEEGEAEETMTEETQEGEAPEAETTETTEIPETHTVAAGENLYRIGLQYGFSWVSIAQLNNITNPDRIYVGQVLQLPGGDPGAGGQPEPVPTPEGVNYIVQNGDTLFKIGLQFGVTWTEIAEANGLVNPNQIYTGQTLKIPVDAPTPPPVVQHVVQPGETLFRISLQYGVSWMAIAQVNDITPPFFIYAGQTLVIPGGQ